MEFRVFFFRLLCGAIGTIGLVYLYSWHRYRQYNFPPSPKGRLPIIGHAHLLPKRLPGDKAKEWGIQTSEMN